MFLLLLTCSAVAVPCCIGRNKNKVTVQENNLVLDIPILVISILVLDINVAQICHHQGSE